MTIELLDITPVPGEIQRDTPVQFDIRTTDSSPFLRVVVAIKFPGSNVVELAYAQDPASVEPFEAFYDANSSVVVVTDAGFLRYQFTLLRQADGTAVWPDSPQLMIYGFNDAGEEL